MNNDNGMIDSRVYEAGENYRTVCALKSSAGKLFVDARKWFKFKNQDEFYPSKLGIMLSVEDWPIIMKNITELLTSANCNIVPKTETKEL